MYADLFAIDANMNAAPEPEVRGAMLRITGKDEETVGRYFATFKTLAGLARFDAKPSRPTPAIEAPQEPNPPKGKAEDFVDHGSHRRRSEYHYNIQIHLPVTTDITVYNAIFKSLKENLGI